MERIRRNDYIAQVSNLLGKGEGVVLTGHRRALNNRCPSQVYDQEGYIRSEGVTQ